MDNAIVLTTAVLGIVQAFKIAGLPSKFSPIFAMVVGLVVFTIMEGVSPQNAVTGIVIGLSAVGLYTTGSQLGEEEINISERELNYFKNRTDD